MAENNEEIIYEKLEQDFYNALRLTEAQKILQNLQTILTNMTITKNSDWKFTMMVNGKG